MTGASKSKGDRGEREVVTLLHQLLKILEICRELGAGRKDDIGDIAKVPNTAIQVAWRENMTGAIYEKVEEVERQRKNKGVRFAAVFVKKNNRPWVVTMTPEQWARMWKYAQIGLKASASTRAAKKARLPNHAPRSRKPGPGSR